MTYQPPAESLTLTLAQAGHRIGCYGVIGWTVEDVLDRRPDLTAEQALVFLKHRDAKLADALLESAGDILSIWLEDSPEIPAEPDNLDDLIDARARGTS